MWRAKVNNWLKYAQALMLPGRCVLCRAVGLSAPGLCAGCAAELPWHPGGCERCGAVLTVTGVCGVCQQRPVPMGRTVAALRYEGCAVTLATGLKFAGKLEYAPILAECLRQRLDEQRVARPERIIPVPLHRARLRERGYNQAVELARLLARVYAVPLDVHSCARVRATLAQAELNAEERRRNVRGAFRVMQPLGVRHVAIVDDVLTTGSTVEALACALRHAGVEHIQVWAAVRAV